MKKYMFFIVAMLAMVACSNKDANEPVGKVTIKATIDIPESAQSSMRRVRPDNLENASINFLWEEGDQVVLECDDSEEDEYSVFTIVPGSISDDKKSAQFTGIPKGSMDDGYQVKFGVDPEKVEQEVDYIEDSFKPFAFGAKTENGFTLSVIGSVLKLKIKGNTTLGKVKYSRSVSQQEELTTILNCSTGIALDPNVAKTVYFPLCDGPEAGNNDGIKLDFF